jgi:hypothetical protein
MEHASRYPQVVVSLSAPQNLDCLEGNKMAKSVLDGEIRPVDDRARQDRYPIDQASVLLSFQDHYSV